IANANRRVRATVMTPQDCCSMTPITIVGKHCCRPEEECSARCLGGHNSMTRTSERNCGRTKLRPPKYRPCVLRLAQTYLATQVKLICGQEPDVKKSGVVATAGHMVS